MSASKFSPSLSSSPAEIVPVRGDVFDFSAIPAFGPLPLLDEDGPAPVVASRSRRGAFLAAAIVAVSAGYATWSAATWTHRRDGGDAALWSQAATILDDPTTTGSIPLALRPTIR